VAEFRPTPPPPTPPHSVPEGGDGARVGGWTALTTRRRWALELLVALVLLIAMGALAAPSAPPPLSATERWAQRATPALDRLATDIAAAGTAPPIPSPVAGRLERDLAALERVGPPPAAADAGAYERATADVEAALRSPDGPETGRDLAAAGLELEQIGGPNGY
jgi:hypothetical protein